MRIAIVGCGYVADYYLKTLAWHPELELAGVTDRVPQRLSKFAAYYSLYAYRSLEELLADKSIDLVVNLTNPRSHFFVSEACLEADKHVYSEKPLSIDIDEAGELMALARRRGLYLASAPCSILGETAQTLWKLLRENIVGSVRLVYAELDDGPLHRLPYKTWLSASGTPWPSQDEFETGCTLEHAAYYLSWLAAFFGPARTVTAFSSCLMPDKQTDGPPLKTPDFSVACIKFSSGVVARLTCSILALKDHSLRIFGDKGVLGTDDCWNYRSPVYVKRIIGFKRDTVVGLMKKDCPLLGQNIYAARDTGKDMPQMDFCRGIADIAAAISENRPPRLTAEFSFHINELALAIHNALETSATYTLSSTFEPMEPMDWARS
jgi:predicted dehydrogenase